LLKHWEALDDKIDLNQQMNRVLETVGEAVFKRWFVDFEFPNEEGKPYKSSGGEMVLNEKLEKTIPKGWQAGEINDLCSSITNGGTPKRMESKYWNGNIPWFKTGELTDGPLIDSEEHITEEGLRNSSARLWGKNTILVALYASPTVGRLGLLKTKAASNQACSGLVAKKEIGYGFLFYTLFFKRKEFNNIAVGACQQNISQQIVKESQTIIPPTALLKSFNDIANPLFDKQSSIAVQNRTLVEIRDKLLPKLMSGKVRVPLDSKMERQ
jgi:type I restriction enzyme S subunit